MKKRVLSFLIPILLLSLIAAPCAWAESWISLGTWNIGQSVSFQLTAYAFDDSINAVSIGGEIPPGCSVDHSYASDTGEYGLVLNGLLTTAGSYTFQIVIDGEVNNYSMAVVSEEPTVNAEAANPEPPNVSVLSAPTTCSVGSTTILSVDASVSDGGLLSYQWYRNGEAVFGGNDNSISIATTSPGVYSFYCEVTNTLNGVNSVTDSEEILVEVLDGQVTVSQIFVLSQPTKITYKAGENLDTTGMVIQTVYSDGKTASISSGFSVSPAQFSSKDIGLKTVTVTYGGQTCSFQVNVKSGTSTLSIATMPDKTAYETGDTLNTSGLQLCLTNGSDKQYIQSGFTCSPVALSTPGTQAITVSYNGLTCSFNVSVKSKQTDQLKIETLPSKTTYLVGESLNTEGLVIEKISGTGSAASSQKITSGFNTEPTVLTKAGQQTVIVSYDNLTATFTVNVSETATPAPTEALPTQNAAAQAAIAAANAAANARSQQNSRTGLIIFVTVVAIFALLVLGVYVYLAKADNIEETIIGKLIQRMMDKMNK